VKAWNVVLGDGSRRTAIGEPGNVVAYCFRFNDEIPPLALQMAAAPELLEALEFYADKDKNYDDGWRARAAIAKAKGQ
jgi:hypothetical protein